MLVCPDYTRSIRCKLRPNDLLNNFHVRFRDAVSSILYIQRRRNLAYSQMFHFSHLSHGGGLVGEVQPHEHWAADPWIGVSFLGLQPCSNRPFVALPRWQPCLIPVCALAVVTWHEIEDEKLSWRHDSTSKLTGYWHSSPAICCQWCSACDQPLSMQMLAACSWNSTQATQDSEEHSQH